MLGGWGLDSFRRPSPSPPVVLVASTTARNAPHGPVFLKARYLLWPRSEMSVRSVLGRLTLDEGGNRNRIVGVYITSSSVGGEKEGDGGDDSNDGFR